MRLKENIAIITGGGGGIGTGIAACLAREGADIVIADLRLEAAQETVRQVEAVGRRGLAVVSDVTDESDCRDLIAESIATFGHIDIVVNNAGHFGGPLGGPVLAHTNSEWEEQFGMHVMAPLSLCRAVSNHMVGRKRGKIINISSIAARRDPLFVPAYAAAKNALLSVTRLLAKDLGPHNINVNAICPGMLWTGFWHEMAAELAKSDAAYAGMKPREIFEKFVQGAIPMQREQSPEDIGNLVAFLSSEEARNISGQTICVDGGASMG